MVTFAFPLTCSPKGVCEGHSLPCLRCHRSCLPKRSWTTVTGRRWVMGDTSDWGEVTGVYVPSTAVPRPQSHRQTPKLGSLEEFLWPYRHRRQEKWVGVGSKASVATSWSCEKKKTRKTQKLLPFW